MNSGNILLVNLSISEVSTTSIYVMPPGLLSVVAYLRDHGVPTDFLDWNIFKKNNGDCRENELIGIFEKRLTESKPCMVGASVMVAGQIQLAREILKSVKDISADIVTVVGGAHVSQFPKEILENSTEIDFVVMGEGESQALVCSQFARTKEFPSVWPDGIAYRDKGEIVVKQKQSYIERIDELPFPAYDILDFDDYLHDTSTWHNPYQVEFGVRVPIITSRGCPNLCNFCSVSKCMGPFYRSVSAVKVVDLMQNLIENYDVYYFVIFDANFAQESGRVIDICNEICRRKLKICLDIPTALPINSTAAEMIDALAEVGLIRTCISIESGDDNIRNKIMKKNIKKDDIFKVVEAIRHHPQIFLLTDFVIGMPEDTVESLEESCRIIADLDSDDIVLFIATPYPGTKLFRQCERENLYFPDIDIKNLWMAEGYSHVNNNYFIIKPYDLDMNTLQDYRDRILSYRDIKISAYHKRMKRVFNIESNYRKL